MIEFTMTRVTLGVCGMIMLAAIIAPVSDIYDDRENTELQDQCDHIADMVDAFWNSDTDEMTVNMGTVLPSASCALRFDRTMIELTSNGDSFRTLSPYTVVSDGPYNANDIVRFTKTEVGIDAVKLN